MESDLGITNKGGTGMLKPPPPQQQQQQQHGGRSHDDDDSCPAAELWRQPASRVLAGIRAGRWTVEQYAQSLLRRIDARDGAVKAWAHLDRELVQMQARRLDAVPMEARGPLHGLPVGVKDVIYTKGG